MTNQPDLVLVGDVFFFLWLSHVRYVRVFATSGGEMGPNEPVGSMEETYI